jgi:uncharacterized protein (DUF433 family)
MAISVDQAAEAARLALWIERDPGRLGGTAVFRGTRVPVKSLFDHLRAGDPLETFLEDFPGVTREQTENVIDLAGHQLVGELQFK